MSYVGAPFQHDLFVSYSHGDAGGVGESPLKTWSTAFVDELRRELEALPKLGGKLRVFLDHDHRPDRGLDPLAPLGPQLKNAIAESALLTVLVSPQYIDSRWCADERAWWLQAQPGHALAHEDRIAMVRIWPHDGRLPADLLDGNGDERTGFWFYDREQAQLLPQPYEWPRPHPDSRDPFRRLLLGLVMHIARKLDQTRNLLEERKQRQAEAQKLASSERAVYLHGRMDQRVLWERAAGALADHGFAVLGEPAPAPGDPKALVQTRARRVEVLLECDALLLVGSDDALAVDADMVVVGRGDRQSARAAVQRFLPCGLLDTVGPPVASPQRKSAARALQVDWIDATSEPWATRVHDWLVTKGATLERSS